MAKAEKKELPNYRNEDLQDAKAALKFVKEEWKKATTSIGKADLDLATAKVKIGEYLLEKFFNDDWRLVGFDEKDKHNPVKDQAWKLLITSRSFPVKSKSAKLNILNCGAQSKWAKDEGIDITEIAFTSQVHMTKLKNGTDQKKDAIAIILSGKDEKNPEKDKKWSSREVDTYVRKLTAGPEEPFDAKAFESILFNPDKFIEALKAEADLDDKFKDDFEKYQEYNPDDTTPENKAKDVGDDRRKKMKDKIEVAIKKLAKAITTLREGKESLARKTGSGKKKEVKIDILDELDDDNVD